MLPKVYNLLAKMPVYRTLQFLRGIDSEGIRKGDGGLSDSRIDDGQFGGDSPAVLEENILKDLDILVVSQLKWDLKINSLCFIGPRIP